VGDGRYYTVEQFTNVSMMMVIIMVLTVNLVAYIYQKGGNRKSRQLIGIYFVLFCGLLIRFVSEVIVNIPLAQTLDKLSRVITLGFWIGLFMILAHWVIGLYLKGDKSQRTYTIRYQMVIVISIFMTTCAISTIFMMLGPSTLGTYWYISQFGPAAYILHRLIALKAPYTISASLFTKTKNMLLEYVFIIDSKGNVIYRSSHTEDETLFRHVDKVDPNHVEEVFCKSVEHCIMNGNDYILYKDHEQRTYLSFMRKDIMRQGKSVGEILTFSDVSGLVELLESLKKDQENTEKVNEELRQYAKIVYSLEKEQEIQLLLEDIAENQESSMKALRDQMLLLDGAVDEAFDGMVEEMIQKAKANLASVRQAVSTYKAYYGGEDEYYENSDCR